MKIKDPKALATPRSPVCENCGQSCRWPSERHHIVPRGMAGGSRLDIPENLVDLGGWLDCNCHFFYGRRAFEKQLFEAVARRLGTTARKCRNKVYRLLRAPKGSKVR